MPMRVRRTIGYRRCPGDWTPRRFLLWDDENERIEMPLVIAEDIADEIEDPVFMIEVLPTHERTEVTAVRLNGFEEE